jgi:DnaJ-class molecular chaperone
MVLSEQEFRERMKRPAPAFDGEHECPTCEGAGYVAFGRTQGHPLFGKIRACPTCCAGMDSTAHELGTRNK